MYTHLECIKCGKKHTPSLFNMNCSGHDKYFGHLEVKYDYSMIQEFPVKSENGINRYLPLLPLSKVYITLHEGNTPLYELKHLGKKFDAKIMVKDETRNPTGCFKDRESLILINMAIEGHMDSIFCVSCGNAATSLSAYAKLAQIKCTCFIPEKIHINKKSLVELFGATPSTMGFSYEDCFRKVIDLNCAGWNCASGINPFALEGDKVIAFEIFEDVGVPDKIIVPCGNGTNLAGIYKGFYELYLLGKTSKMPQMFGVQVEGANPIAHAKSEESSYYCLDNPIHSIAESIVASESYSLQKVLRDLKQCDGDIISVTDEEITIALKEALDQESLLLEPASASVFAALKKIKTSEEETVVCVATGSGMKVISQLNSILSDKHKEE